MGKPFKVNETPARNIATKEKAAPPPGKAINESHQTGDRLPNASKNKPDHEPLIPWPTPALGVDHKPFKTNK